MIDGESGITGGILLIAWELRRVPRHDDVDTRRGSCQM